MPRGAKDPPLLSVVEKYASHKLDGGSLSKWIKKKQRNFYIHSIVCKILRILQTMLTVRFEASRTSFVQWG